MPCKFFFLYILEASSTGLGITTFGPASNVDFSQNFDNINAVKPSHVGYTVIYGLYASSGLILKFLICIYSSQLRIYRSISMKRSAIKGQKCEISSQTFSHNCQYPTLAVLSCCHLCFPRLLLSPKKLTIVPQ
jgi:hypothetical protein